MSGTLSGSRFVKLNLLLERSPPVGTVGVAAAAVAAAVVPAAAVAAAVVAAVVLPAAAFGEETCPVQMVAVALDRKDSL